VAQSIGSGRFQRCPSATEHRVVAGTDTIGLKKIQTVAKDRCALALVAAAE
jgi:hypothetical protein